MSDTVYETNHEGNRLTFGRFWREGKDWIQISTNSEYGQLSIDEFRKMVQCVEANVEDTKDAWWHKISKGSYRNR